MSTSTPAESATQDNTRAPDPDDLRHFVEQLSMVLVSMGFPPMPARVWAAMMSDQSDTITPGELATSLGVSPAAISGAVRYLLQVSLIERVPAPGSRRQHYRVSADMWANAFVKRQSVLVEFSEVASHGVEILGENTLAAHRITAIRDFFDYFAGEMPRLLEAWRANRPR
ncbi:GbsR/MarR family transcriptional regulator [Rhodococcus sp. NPDC058521]|uniref:GbsR/MarR family transcriptional regulator n=1 Tax=Rhodococcus sp. NPDC058521 TaxID=3346536 RepID=UPI0036517D6F